jgi:hypothetical protein
MRSSGESISCSSIVCFAETSRGYERVLTSTLGPSDEWATAYAARALLHTNEERSVWAAREAVHALLIEQSSTGKALTDGSFTVLFSTTPLSASRNYSVNIPSVNAFQ